MSGSVGRNLGLVLALLALVIVGAITAGENFTTFSNALVILRQASIIGVISIGMTLVIIAGGIDLSVGSVMGLASIVATLAAIQDLADQTHWIFMIVIALLVGLGAGLINGVVIAYGNVVAFMATLAMLVAARGLAEILAERRTLIVERPRLHQLHEFGLHRRRRPDLDLRDRRRAGLGGAQPHHLRPAHGRDRRQPRGGAPRGHQREAPHDVALRDRGPVAPASPGS